MYLYMCNCKNIIPSRSYKSQQSGSSDFRNELSVGSLSLLPFSESGLDRRSFGLVMCYFPLSGVTVKCRGMLGKRRVKGGGLIEFGRTDVYRVKDCL